jgi:HEAT repeat protein
LRLLEHNDRHVRGNAAIVLSYFPDEAATVAPVLIRVLPEPDPRIRLTIAKALAQVDREAGTKAGVALIATKFLKNPDQQTVELAYMAAEVLGELHAEPSISVPVLTEGLGATNREVAIASFRALARLAGQSPNGLPALRKAAERKDIPNWVKADLLKIDSPAPNL